MLRLLTVVTLALFAFQLLDASEAAEAGLRRIEDGLQLGDPSKLDGLAAAPTRSIEEKQERDQRNHQEPQKQWAIVRFIIWLKDLLLWPFMKIYEVVKHLISKYFA